MASIDSSIAGPSDGRRVASPKVQVEVPARAENPAIEDTDTCRICRGESTATDRLHFPCKCSGTIKYVHQECLMEWLAHSRKKYCELCKTHFRFTKLYDPHMPKELPLSVFLKEAFIQTTSLLVLWCRAALVVCVWLFCLPYCMRSMWRTLFWVGDGEWASRMKISIQDAVHAAHSVQGTRLTNLTVPGTARPLNSTVTSIPVYGPFSYQFDIVLRYLQALRFKIKSPVMLLLFNKFFYGSTSENDGYSRVASSNSTLSLLPGQPSLPSSLLSDVKFFRSLTSWPILNKLAIDVVEGQVITLLVFLAFTLIFLIREWVVQQQPILNIGEAGIGEDDMRPPALEAGFDEGEQRAAANERIGRPEPPAANTVDGNADDTLSESGWDAAELNRTKPTQIAETSEQKDARAYRRVMENISKLNLDLYWLQRISEKVKALPVEPKILLSGRHANSVADQLKGLTIDERHQICVDLKSLKSILEAARGSGEAEEDGKLSSPFVFMFREYFTEEEREKLQHNMSEIYASARVTEKLETVGRLREDLIFFIATIGDRPEHVLSSVDSLIDTIAHYQEVEAPMRSKSPIADTETTELALGQTSRLDGDIRFDGKGKGKARAVLVDMETDMMGKGASSRSDTYTELPSEPEKSLIGTRAKQLNANVSDLTQESKASSNDQEERSLMTPNIDDSTVMATVTNTKVAHHSEIIGRENNSGSAVSRSEATVEPERTWLGWMMDCFWGDAAFIQSDDTLPEHTEGGEGELLHDNSELVEMYDPAQRIGEAEGDGEAEAGVDLQPEVNVEPNQQDLPDDGEDLEGLLELIGAHGPIAGLFQNAVVSAILVTSVITCTIWFPYLWGKVFLVFLGNPVTLLLKLPVRFLLAVSDFIADFSLMAGGSVVYWIVQLTLIGLKPLHSTVLLSSVYSQINALADSSKVVALSALRRLNQELSAIFVSPDADMLFLSANAHLALRNVEGALSNNIKLATEFVWGVCHNLSNYGVQDIPRIASIILHRHTDFILRSYRNVPSHVTRLLESISAFDLFSLNSLKSRTSLESNLKEPNWTATDRVVVILTGYTFFALLGALYLKYGKPLSSSANGRKVERILSDVLQQAGGVLKVILIISIEMIIFPLYCGLLLDVALLPLFEDATVRSRVIYTIGSPWKAGFIHWFIGTCYMYHFALFVSMCRKMMRSGVLYFIRDPDDPNFHPVRDVLERSVTTQLRKITFSAIVYGAMIIVSLGGVIWTIYRFFDSLFPIRWTTEPFFEFSIDILLYCFLTPILLKYVHIQEFVHKMFGWWFRRSAKSLRLSHFLFGKRQLDEEGYYLHPPLVIANGQMDADSRSSCDKTRTADKDHDKEKGSFQRTGRFVRAPATDQVRIPKGSQIFVELDGADHPAPEMFENGNHDRSSRGNRAMKTMVVYIPPNFAARIALFICSIWLYAAGLGLTVTVIPLITGRYIFSTVTAESTLMNDIYAYSLGIYMFGGLFYIGKKVKMASRSVTIHDLAYHMNFRGGLCHLKSLIHQATSLLYVYGILLLTAFFLLSLFIEIYILVPLHTIYRPNESHTVHIIQNWTLGFLYGRLIAHYLFQNPDSRPSRVLRAVTGSNYAQPNAWLATRCFALPAALAFTIALVLPYLLSLLTTSTIFAGREDRIKVIVHRMAYPAILLVIFSVWFCFALKRAVGKWRMRIRDEVYLVGERLHNYGEKKARPGPPARIVKR